MQNSLGWKGKVTCSNPLPWAGTSFSRAATGLSYSTRHRFWLKDVFKMLSAPCRMSPWGKREPWWHREQTGQPWLPPLPATLPTLLFTSLPAALPTSTAHITDHVPACIPAHFHCPHCGSHPCPPPLPVFLPTSTAHIPVLIQCLIQCPHHCPHPHLHP